MAVTTVTLASRAAIRGGVNAYESYRLSELYMQKISICTNAMEILQIHMQAVLKFAELVRQSKENRNYDCVEQCKVICKTSYPEVFSGKGIRGGWKEPVISLVCFLSRQA